MSDTPLFFNGDNRCNNHYFCPSLSVACQYKTWRHLASRSLAFCRYALWKGSLIGSLEPPFCEWRPVSVWRECGASDKAASGTRREVNPEIRMSVTPMCYEAQHFEFTPQTCILRLYVTFQDFLFEMLLVVERVILNKLESCPGHRISKFHVRQSTEKYLQFINERSNHLFQKMEQCLLKLVFQVPKNIVLPEDRVHIQYPYSAIQYKELQSETETLQKQYKAECLATQCLLAELEEQKTVEAELEKVLAWFDGLDKICRGHGNIDLKESFAFMTQSITRLQGTMEEIQVKTKKRKVDISSVTPISVRTRKRI